MKKTDSLRERAEKEVQKAKVNNSISENTADLVHELQVHQAELEMQNEELRHSQEEYAELYNKYLDLYNDVPVGYFTLDTHGIIRNVNDKGVKLLQTEKENIIGCGFSPFIPKTEEWNYYQALANSSDTCENQKLELQLKRNGTLFDANMEVMPIFDKDGSRYRVIITDITERKKAEEELKRNEERYRSIGELIPFGAWTTDAQGHATYISQLFCDLVGRTEEEIIKFGWIDTLHPDDRERTLNDWRKNVEEGGFWDYTHRVMGIDGKYHYVLARGTPLKDEDGEITGWVGVNIDITGQKKLETELKKSHHNLEEKVEKRTKELELAGKYNRSLIEASLDPLATIGSDGKIDDVNRATELITGYSRDEIIGTDFCTYFTEPEKAKEGYKEVFNKGEVRNYPLYIKHKNGRITPVNYNASVYKDESGEVIGVFAAARDITEREKAEEENKRSTLILYGINQIFQAGLTVESEEKLAQSALKVIENIIGSSFGFICEITPERLLNTLAISFTGWEECRIPHSRRLIMATDLPIMGIRGRVIEDAKPLIFNDAKSHPDWIEPPEGHTNIQSFLGVPLIYAGEVFGEIGLAHKDKDFSKEDLEAAELISFALVEALNSYRNKNKLKESVSELKRSNEELERFAYVSSHDLQEPLRTIASFTQLLERRYKGKFDSDADEFMDFIVEAAVRMKAQIEGLLEYSRVGTKGGEFKSVDTNEILKQTIERLDTFIKESNAEITYEKLPSVNGDAEQLQRVFQNLISNAIRFRKCEEPLKIHISAYKAEDRNEYIFSISDNGIGIEEQYSERIFTIFQRLHTRNVYKGTGIGLSIVKRIIERHGGCVWVESEFGVGSTFYFTIPSGDSDFMI